MAFPAAVYLALVQKSGELGSEPHPQAPFVRSLYQVVEAQGRPLKVGGQPSHRESSGDSGWSHEDSPVTPGDVRAREQNTSTNIAMDCVNWEIER